MSLSRQFLWRAVMIPAPGANMYFLFIMAWMCQMYMNGHMMCILRCVDVMVSQRVKRIKNRWLSSTAQGICWPSCMTNLKVHSLNNFIVYVLFLCSTLMCIVLYNEESPWISDLYHITGLKKSQPIPSHRKLLWIHNKTETTLIWKGVVFFVPVFHNCWHCVNAAWRSG